MSVSSVHHVFTGLIIILGCAVRAIMTSACIIRLAAGFLNSVVMMCAVSPFRKMENWCWAFVIQ